MAKKSSEKKSSPGKRDSGSVMKDLEKKAAKALATAEDFLTAAKKAAEDAAKSAEKAKTSAKKAKSSSKAVSGVGSAEAEAALSESGSDSARSKSIHAVSGTTSTPRSKAPSVSADGAAVTGAPPMPSPDSDDAPSIAWSVARLRGVARERGVSGYWSMRKTDLVDALTVPTT